MVNFKKNIIFFIGMPAAGKTFWGAKVAQHYGLPFIDLDTFISAEEKTGIPALFEQYGEHAFREIERKHLEKIIKNTKVSTIVACGGGTPCFFDNMTLMKDNGTVICLEAEISQLVSNINGNEDIRPLLRDRDDIGAYLRELLQKRKHFYEQAHYILHTKDISLLTFDKIISSCISRP